MLAVPPMHGVTGLGASGPFPHASQPLWMFSLPSHARTMDLRTAPTEALGIQEMPPSSADRFSASFLDAGAEFVWVADAWGGRPGLVKVWWDVRVVPVRTGSRQLGIDLFGGHQEPILGGRMADICATTPEIVATWVSRTPAWRTPAGRNKFGIPLETRGGESSLAAAVVCTEGAVTWLRICTPAAVTSDAALADLIDVVLSDLRAERRVADNGTTAGGTPGYL